MGQLSAYWAPHVNGSVSPSIRLCGPSGATSTWTIVSSLFIAAAEKSGAAILAIPVAGTLKRVGKDRVVAETVSRERLWEAQTPQVFRREWLQAAYAQRGSEAATDDAELVHVDGLGEDVVGAPLDRA